MHLLWMFQLAQPSDLVRQRSHLYLTYYCLLLVIGRNPSQSWVKEVEMHWLFHIGSSGGFEVLMAEKFKYILRNCCLFFRSFSLLFSLISSNCWQRWLLRCCVITGQVWVMYLLGGWKQQLQSNHTERVIY